MGYKVVFDGIEYWAEVNVHKGFHGTYYDPPEPPTFDITSITDENGDEIDDDIFDSMEESIMQQLSQLLQDESGGL